MESLKIILRPRRNRQQLLKYWQRKFRHICRKSERRIRGVQKDQQSLNKAIKEAVKRDDPVLAQTLAKEVLRSRKNLNRLHGTRAQLNSILVHLGEFAAMARTEGPLKNVELMKLINNLIQAPELAATMHAFSKDMIKAGVIEETVDNAVDTTLHSEDIEEEIEDEVGMVLAEVACEVEFQLPESLHSGRLRQPTLRRASSTPSEPKAFTGQLPLYFYIRTDL